MGNSLLVAIIESINEIKGHYPGKKELQKTIYLLQKKVPLATEYAYRFHFYGPYSDALDEEIQRLTIQGTLTISRDGNTHRITLTDSGLDGLKHGESVTEAMRDTIKDLVEISPVNLELMATIIFLLDNHLVSDAASEADVVAKVHEVKNDKYRDEEIQQYYRLLKDKRYLN